MLLFGTSVDADNSQRYLKKFKVFEPAKPLLAPDIQVKPEFVKGKGALIGHVQKIQGKVYVIHKGEKVAYVLKKKLPLFTGDTLITEKRSRVNAAMNDKSVFALAPLSKLVIDKSVYDAEKNTRNSLMSVLWGQVRFIVDKVAGKPNFTVKTKTAVCGVRGSDFAISVGPAGENTSSIPKRDFFADLFLIREAHGGSRICAGGFGDYCRYRTGHHCWFCRHGWCNAGRWSKFVMCCSGRRNSDCACSDRRCRSLCGSGFSRTRAGNPEYAAGI